MSREYIGVGKVDIEIDEERNLIVRMVGSSSDTFIPQEYVDDFVAAMQRAQSASERMVIARLVEENNRLRKNR